MPRAGWNGNDTTNDVFTLFNSEPLFQLKESMDDEDDDDDDDDEYDDDDEADTEVADNDH